MNLLVVLRPVRDPAGFSVNRKAQKIFSNREGFILNPSDRNALEAALALVGPDGNVTAVAIGGEPALETLRTARASGAGRALRIVAAEAAALDPLGVTTVLQQVITHIGGVDLVLLGSDVLDSDSAQVGPRLAAALGWPYADHAYQATALAQGGLGLVVSAADGFQLIGVDLPAVASIARDSNKPRFAPAAQIITVFGDPDAVETLTLADLGLDPAGLAPATVTRGESFPPERTLGQIVDGEDAVRQFTNAARLSP
jgi:electron transfer flavoprotein beta subunit